MSNRVNKKLLYGSSFFVPIFLYLIIFKLHGIWPFGDATVMTGDMQYQFIDYLSYLKTIVFGNNDFSYSFSKNLGGNMAGFSAYYYNSPLNFLTLLFPSTMLPVAVGIVLLIYSGLSSLSFTYMLSKIYGEKYQSLPFSLGYSMMAFTATYFQLTIYFGNLIMLPLLILGLVRLIEDPKRNRLYIATLFLSILFNYYAGYMVCIFSVIFFTSQLLLRVKNIKDILSYKSTIAVFMLSSLIGAMLTAFNLIPAVKSLAGEKDNLSIGFFRTFPMHKVFSQFFTCAFDGNVSNGLPNIFCGIVIILLALKYFADKRFALKERVVYFTVIAFLFINLYLNTLNVVWHGFNQPIGFPYRNSYFITFMVLWVAYREIAVSDVNLSNFVLPGIIIALYAISILFLYKANSQGILLDIAIVFICVVISVTNKSYSKRIMLTTFLLFQVFDLTFNEYSAMGKFSLASLTEYQNFLSQTGEKVNWINDNDDGFFRIEKYFRRTNNDAMQFNYAGLSHFSSSEKKNKIKFMGKLGFRDNGNWAFYNESTTRFIDGLFGVRYIISQHHSTPNYYPALTEKSDYMVFGNDSALPLIFTAKESIRDIDYTKYNDPFMLQNDIADSLNGRKNEILRRIEPCKVDIVNLEVQPKDGYTHYTKIDPESEAYIEYTIDVASKDVIYGYFTAPTTGEAEIICDGLDRESYFSTYRWNIINLHDFEVGKKLSIKILLKSDELDYSDAYFYYENADKVDGLFSEVKENKAELKKITSSHLSGRIDINDSDSIAVISIPYDEAWKVKVDGEAVKAKPAINMLMSFDVTKGEHEVELYYTPSGKNVGIIISLITLSILMLWEIKKRRSK